MTGNRIHWLSSEPDAAVEMFLGDDFNSWIPSKGAVEFRDSLGGMRTVQGPAWFKRYPSGELEIQLCRHFPRARPT